MAVLYFNMYKIKYSSSRALLKQVIYNCCCSTTVTVSLLETIIVHGIFVMGKETASDREEKLCTAYFMFLTNTWRKQNSAISQILCPPKKWWTNGKIFENCRTSLVLSLLPFKSCMQ